MLSTSPYVVGGPEMDLLLESNPETEEVWRRHSFDVRAHQARADAWAARASCGAAVAPAATAAAATPAPADCPTATAAPVSIAYSVVKPTRASDCDVFKPAPQHSRLSMPSLQRHSFPSTAASSSSSAAPFRPWSSGGSTASSSVADDSSGSPLTTTSVRFVGVATKDAHCVYSMHVETSAEQFVVNKRFSQFRAFRLELFALLQQAQHCGNGPCKQLLQLTQLKFPRRRLLQQWKRGADLAVARERLVQLQRFTDAMLRVYRLAPRRQLRCCVNSGCAAMEAVRRFLEISARDDTVVLTPPVRSPARESLSAAPPAATATAASVEPSAEPPVPAPASSVRPRQSRGFPPPTRVSIAAETDHQFDQLYTITEDSELVHLHA